MEPQAERWFNGKAETLPDEFKQIETMLLPMRVVDSCLNRQYYQTPDTGIEFSDAMAIATGNLSAAGVGAFARRQRFNLVKSVVDAYCAMVVQVPAIDVTTTGGSWAQRRSAEALGLFIDGVFAGSNMKDVTWNCVIDSCLSRVAAVRVDDSDGQITVRRLQPHQVTWNPAEGRSPRNIYTNEPYSRGALMAEYENDPAKYAAIKGAPNYKCDPLFEGIDGVYSWNKVDTVGVFEAWRTSDSDGKDGWYVKAVRGRDGVCVLESKAWNLPKHCIVPLRFSPSYGSYSGCPAGDTLMAYQAELDDFAATIKEAFVKGAVLRVLVPKGAEVDKKTLNDTQGQIVEFNKGFEPVFNPGATLPPEYIAREQIIIERAHEFMGISYNSARGVKADGISSAKGQREVAALAQNRLILNMQTIQDWIVEVGKVIILVADRKYDGKKDITVKVPGSKLLNKVTWSEIGYKQEDFDIHCDAINSLSRHPAARAEEVLELVQGGILDERAGLKVLRNKDLQSAQDEAFSNEDFAEKIIDLALSGDYRAPDPYMGSDGLQMLIKRGRARYVQEMVQKKPSDYLNLLRQLIEAAKTEVANLDNAKTAGLDPAPAIDPMAAAAMGTPGTSTAIGAPGGAPMAVPGAGLPASLGAAAAPAPVGGQGLA